MFIPFSECPILFVFFGLFAAALLFLVRIKFAIVYGVIEIAAGMVLLMLAYRIAGGSFSSHFDNSFDIVRSTIEIAASIGAVLTIVGGLTTIRNEWPSLTAKS